MSNNQLYIDPINNAIASGDLEKMKALLIRAKKKIGENTKLVKATKKLEVKISRIGKK